MTGEGFLSRWSRRKRAAAGAAPEAPEAPAPAPATAAPSGSPPAAGGAAAPPEPEVDPASLPPIESLTPESDFSAFLRKGVPAALQRAALRRAWSLDPAIRDFVGPADYAWDYNAPAGVPGFAPDLPEEARRMALRMLGLEREEDAPAGPPAEAAAEHDEPQAVSTPPATARPDGPRDAAPAAAVIAEAPPIPETPPEAAAVARPAVRRHGSALPS